MRDNERLRKQVELERDETIAALRDAEALRAALKDASNRAADARARPWPPTRAGPRRKLGRLRASRGLARPGKDDSHEETPPPLRS